MRLVRALLYPYNISSRIVTDTEQTPIMQNYLPVYDSPFIIPRIILTTMTTNLPPGVTQTYLNRPEVLLRQHIPFDYPLMEEVQIYRCNSTTLHVGHVIAFETAPAQFIEDHPNHPLQPPRLRLIHQLDVETMDNEYQGMRQTINTLDAVIRRFIPEMTNLFEQDIEPTQA